MRFQRIAAAFVLTMGISVATLAAQVTRLDDLDQFGAARVLLSFGEVPGTGLAEPGDNDLGDVFDRWGVRFQTVSQARLRLSTFTAMSPSHFPLGDFYEIENQPMPEGSDGPLTVTFQRAAARVGLYLQGDGQDIELRAFTPDGEDLGAVQLAGIDDFPGSSLLGVETSDPRGIGMVSVRYNATDPVERISEVVVEYLTQASGFSVILPQVAFGSIGGIALDTQVNVTNLSNRTANVTVSLFQDDGSPLTTTSAQDGTLTRTLAPFESTSFTPSDGATLESAVRVGYASIESSEPLDATAVYTTFDSQGPLLNEAGVGATIAQFAVNGYVEKSSATGLNTGLAIVNRNPESLELSLSVHDAEGTLNASRTLGPGEHVSVFLDELFPDLQIRDFHGSILLRASGRFAATLLRTRGGTAAASVPLGGLLLPKIR